jgi:hypothetical protein
LEPDVTVVLPTAPITGYVAICDARYAGWPSTSGGAPPPMSANELLGGALCRIAAYRHPACISPSRCWHPLDPPMERAQGLCLLVPAVWDTQVLGSGLGRSEGVMGGRVGRSKVRRAGGIVRMLIAVVASALLATACGSKASETTTASTTVESTTFSFVPSLTSTATVADAAVVGLAAGDDTADRAAG